MEFNLNRLGEHIYLQNCTQMNIPLKEEMSVPLEMTKIRIHTHHYQVITTKIIIALVDSSWKI